MNYENIIIEQEGYITLVTINRPKKLNALNKATLLELNQALEALEAQKSTRAIIITGSGEKAFVAGADIAEFANFSVMEGTKMAAEAHEMVFNRIENFPIPVIAAINGFALGGGLELAMACHFRVASDNARMGLPEVSLGVIPGYGGTQRLPQLVGKGKAMEMIMTGGMIDSDNALASGLINHKVPQEELLPSCKKIAAKIAANSPTAIAKAINTVNAGFTTGTDGYKAEINAFGACFATQDFKEGTTAFLEKRKAEFTGE